MNLWVWSRSVDFRLGFSLQGFCVLYFILSEFLTKDVLECIVNSTYLVWCCHCTPINLVLKTIVLIFNTIHKMGCCEYCYWLGWYNIWCMKSGSRNPLFLFPKEMSTCNNFCLIIYCYYHFFILFLILCFWYLHYVIFAFQ